VASREKKPFKEYVEFLANEILEIDPGVIGCHIVVDPNGPVIADVVKPDFRKIIGQFSQAGSGMGPQWGMLGLKAFRRLDSERSKLNYITVVRNAYTVLIFPVSLREDEVVIGIELEKGNDPAQFYDAIMKLIGQES
jgi:hypothetical protein